MAVHVNTFEGFHIYLSIEGIELVLIECSVQYLLCGEFGLIHVILQRSGTSILVSDLARIAPQERSLMDQSRELLSTLASMHVSSTICSVLFHFICNDYRALLICTSQL